MELVLYIEEKYEVGNEDKFLQEGYEVTEKRVTALLSCR